MKTRSLLCLTLLCVWLTYFRSNAQFLGGCGEYYGMNSVFQQPSTTCCPQVLTPTQQLTADYSPYVRPCPCRCYSYKGVSVISSPAAPAACCPDQNYAFHYVMTILPGALITPQPTGNPFCMFLPVAADIGAPFVTANITVPFNNPNIAAIFAYATSRGYSTTTSGIANSPIVLTWDWFTGCPYPNIGTQYIFRVTVGLDCTAPLGIGTGALFDTRITSNGPFLQCNACIEGHTSIAAPASCSADPNSKEVYPIGCHNTLYDHIINNGDVLTYTIHFQNVGTADAYQVVINDYLSPYLDVSTFQLIGGTFPINYYFPSASTVALVMQGITLPPASVNFFGSQGDAVFQIKPLPLLPTGTYIKNYADIVFDANAPISTNSVYNVIASCDPPRQELYAPGSDFLTIYPNPFKEQTEIQFLVNQSGFTTLKIYDALGQEVKTLYEGTPAAGKLYSVTLDAAELKEGIYYCFFNSNGVNKIDKIVLLK